MSVPDRVLGLMRAMAGDDARVSLVPFSEMSIVKFELTVIRGSRFARAVSPVFFDGSRPIPDRHIEVFFRPVVAGLLARLDAPAPAFPSRV